jgi:hypothetical protein
MMLFKYEWQYYLRELKIVFYCASKSHSSKFVRDISSTLNNFIKYSDLKRLTSRTSYKNKFPVIRMESVSRTKEK